MDTRLRLRTAALALLLWVLVVAVGSTLVWVVISRAGEGIATRGNALAPTTDLPPTNDAARRQRLSSRPPASVSPAPTLRPSDPPATTTAPSTSAGPAAQRRSWSGSAGLVIVDCRGDAASLVVAQPSADGYAVEVKDRGPSRVEVEFQGRGDEDGAEATIVASCVGGVPVFGRGASGDGPESGDSGDSRDSGDHGDRD